MNDANMDINNLNVNRLGVNQLKEEILALITTLKLTEREIISLEAEEAKWKGRVELARERGSAELLGEAEGELEKVSTRLALLREEERSFKDNIEALRRRLPFAAASERSIDPDVLEQELLMTLGKTEDEVKTDKAFRELEKEKTAESALEALKAKMGKTGEQGG